MPRFTALLILTVLCAAAFAQDRSPDLMGPKERLRTSYQQAGRYDPRYDLKTDAVMVYGISDEALAGLPAWVEKSGSVVQVMTGVAWGSYQDYWSGAFDGVTHEDDGQVNGAGKPVIHGIGVPYMNPSVAFGDYLLARLKKVVDAGVETIFLEEPEFWAFAGYGESFQREWRVFFNEDWVRPDSSCDAMFRSGLLKAHLYRRVISTLTAGLKEYSLKKYGRPLSVYVATHSLLSYAQIRMVSPEATLLDLSGVDGLIAQVWTGTARSPNDYNGAFKERTFEMAMLEYGVMSEMTRGTGKRVYFLNDPIEDDPKHDWSDYRKNYFCTLVASLMRSDTAYYETAPWPSRVLLGRYPADSPEATGIPADYASILCAGFQQLRDMDQSEVSWNGAAEGIGVFLSDSAMFERGANALWSEGVSDPPSRTNETLHERERLDGFFGLTLPLLKAGVPVAVPVLDHLTRFVGYLDPYRVLILSYEFQKPLAPGLHAELVDWVRRGGVLVYVGAGSDPYHRTSMWWNRGRADYQSCDEHLFASLGLERSPSNGVYSCGEGAVLVERTDPAYYTRSSNAATEYLDLIDRAAQQAGLERPIRRNYFYKTRGPYILAACLDESVSSEPLVLEGRFVDLLDAALSVKNRVEIVPDTRAWLLDLDRVSGPEATPLVCGGRISDWTETPGGIEFKTSSPQGVRLIARLRLAQKPAQVLVGGQALDDWSWDEPSRTLYVSYPVDSAEPVSVTIR